MPCSRTTARSTVGGRARTAETAIGAAPEITYWHSEPEIAALVPATMPSSPIELLKNWR